MKKVKTLIALVFSLATMSLFGQQKDPVLMKVGNNVVTKEEFKAIFTKNLRDTVITNEALDEYMVLFTKFKLKVTEAEALGLDTTKKFKDELAGYRKQLARPYLTDMSLSEELVKEAYDRMQEEVRASHILVKCEMDASPKDSLAAYKKAMEFRDRILKGEDFAKVASAKHGSDDPSAAKNGGDIGYFSALQMVYPFESAAYKMKVGDVSMPVRTKFGYHIIKLTDRRPARGQVRVSHILVSSRDEDDPKAKEAAQKKVNEILEKLNKGEDFGTLARQYSDDGSSAKKGGELAPFGPGKMVMEFEEAAFGLKNVGDLSSVVKSAYGYHIIKLAEKIPLATFDEMKGTLKQKVSRDTRSILPKKAFMDKLKKKYKFKENKSSIQLFYTGVDTSIMHSRWKKEYLVAASSYVRPTNTAKVDDGLIKDDGNKRLKVDEKNVDVKTEIPVPTDEKKIKALQKQIMFSFAGKKYSQWDFAIYLEKNQRRDKEMEMKRYLDQSFHTWIYDEIISHEDAQLESLYPEFKLLMKEYRDGILLFELTDQKVWNKAVKDTAGLRAFYTENKSKYMWPVRYEVDIYTCISEETANNLTADLKAGFIEKTIEEKPDEKSKSKNKKPKVKIEKLPVTNDLLKEKYNKDSQLNLRIESGKFAKEDKDVFAQITLEEGISPIVKKNDQFIVVKISEVLQPMNKTLNEAKGIITADYQGFLENEWIKELEGKYKVEIFKDVLYSIK